MTTTKPVLGMRDAFFEALHPIVRADQNVIIISADNGAPMLDTFWQTLPDQCFSVGIAEQQMIGMACGMAFEGKKVYTYAIAPFITLRCYEQNKLDMCAMNLPVVNLGVGAGYAYDIMGPTHHTAEDIAVMRALPNLVMFSPADGVTAAALARISYECRSPQYIRFDRAGIPNLYHDREVEFTDGLALTRPGRNMCIIATGIMVHQALKASERLAREGLDVGVVDLFRLKPVNEDLLLQHLADVPRVVTLEEHRLPGGLGSMIAEIFVDRGLSTPLLRLGLPDVFVFDLGGREAIWENYGLDVETIVQRITRWTGR
ncbi:MAG: 1-deoxy-D-xylulose-5-phosphate synthase [Chloroflexi bacterium]|nr:1-deoxy-D-xylulose-5-phosphate synthase [Chloroflexota bacterium]